ncbi:DUF1653 domain-containing protein [Lichenicola sp.]|uniref:DUF1653 domain-containing protein n=1 Tax=Lichenicola sp. TaxID=2804529 RepID=UPI003B002FBB
MRREGETMQPTQPEPGLYRHYKGGFYTVTGLARHSETEEWLVLYRAEADGSLWVRPQAMWVETVVHEGRVVARFGLVSG